MHFTVFPCVYLTMSNKKCPNFIVDFNVFKARVKCGSLTITTPGIWSIIYPDLMIPIIMMIFEMEMETVVKRRPRIKLTFVKNLLTTSHAMLTPLKIRPSSPVFCCQPKMTSCPSIAK